MHDPLRMIPGPAPGRRACRSLIPTALARILSSAIVVVTLALCLHAQTATDAEKLTQLLNEFLAGASRNDAAMHDRFWAEDLIYTSSSGSRIGKPDIMRDVRSAPAPKPGDPITTYAAEDIRIHLYGDTAVVAFRLIGTVGKDGMNETTNYLNTGAFLKRNGKWQAVSWQATRMPPREDETKALLQPPAAKPPESADTIELSRLETVWNEAHLRGDAEALDRLWADELIVTVQEMPVMTKSASLGFLRSGRMKFQRYETSDLRIRVYQDAAVVTGRVVRARNINGRDVEDNWRFTKVYILRAGKWQVVAWHASAMAQ
ncbi:MAG TPA: nuclear transport factor 2 family protein [Blastocatellia bacterium]|nr:nuclear transport factor 2 family protein [Blastocatellia bacterium]